MTQTIEQLTARVRELEEQYELAANLANTSMDRVRELEEENVRLRFALADTEALELGTSERLAASQAEIKRLEERRCEERRLR